MSQYIITASGLTKVYGRRAVVDDVTFNIEKGTICGLIGRNGAGKTTLLRLLTGLIHPTKGTYSIMAGEQRHDGSVSAIVEQASLCTTMTARENITLRCKLLGIDLTEEMYNSLMQLVGLIDVDKKKVKSYSLGMRQRLAIAMTLIGNPKVLLLDEPINGLDPQGIVELRELLLNLNREMGVTIVISSHILSELDKLANDYLIMDNGKVLSHISAEKLQEHSKKGLKIVAKDYNKAYQLLIDNGYKSVNINSDNSIVLYDDVQSTAVLLLLAQNNIDVLSVTSIGGTLEDVYMQLIGGNKQ